MCALVKILHLYKVNSTKTRTPPRVRTYASILRYITHIYITCPVFPQIHHIFNSVTVFNVTKLVLRTLHKQVLISTVHF